MPIEIRRIILDDEELISAINSYRRVRDDLLPPGSILSVAPGDDGGAAVQIEFKFGPNVRTDTFALTTPHLVEAMIRFCIETNVVVPRQGKRSAGHTAKGWTLEMLLTGTELEHTGLATVADGPKPKKQRLSVASGG